MENKFDLIVQALKEKSSVKQQICKNTAEVFTRMLELAKKLCVDAAASAKSTEPFVPIDFQEDSEIEFSTRFSGDLLVFSMICPK